MVRGDAEEEGGVREGGAFTFAVYLPVCQRDLNNEFVVYLRKEWGDRALEGKPKFSDSYDTIAIRRLELA